MSDIEVKALASTKVKNSDTLLDVEQPNLEALVNTSESITAEVEPKSYVLSSGGIYNGSRPPGAVPQWILDAVQEELTTGDGNITSVLTDIQALVDTLDVGVTQLTNRVHTAETSISSLETSVASRLATNEAAILNLDTTRVTDTEAQAIAADVVQSTFNNDVDAYVGSIASTYVDANSAIAQDIDLIAAEQGNVSASVTRIDEAIVEADVANPAWVDDGIQTDPDVSGNPRFLKAPRAKSSLTVDADGNIAGFAAEADGDNSEFRIFADTFSVTNGTQSHQPLTIDTTTGNSKFNGIVDFTNTNVANGYPGTTSINGGLIEADSIWVGGNVESSNYDWNGGTPIGFGLFSAGDLDSGSSYNIVGGSIFGANTKGAIIRSGWVDYLDGFGALTNWQHYTTATVPVSSEGNFASNGVNNLVTDLDGYVRLPSIRPYTLNTTYIAESGVRYYDTWEKSINYDFNIYPVDSYQVNTSYRVVTDLSTVTTATETFLYITTDGYELSKSYFQLEVADNVVFGEVHAYKVGSATYFDLTIKLNNAVQYTGTGNSQQYLITVSGIPLKISNSLRGLYVAFSEAVFTPGSSFRSSSKGLRLTSIGGSGNSNVDPYWDYTYTLTVPTITVD